MCIEHPAMTSSRPMAEPMSVRGIGEVRGSSEAGSEATAYDQRERKRQIGHTEARTVE